MTNYTLRRAIAAGLLMLLPACTLEVGIEHTAEAAAALSETPQRTVTPATARPSSTRRPSATPSPTSTQTQTPAPTSASTIIPPRSNPGNDNPATATPVPPPTVVPSATPTNTPTPLPSPSRQPSIERFEAAPLVAPAGSSITLSWEATGTDFTIKMLLPDGSTAQTFDGLASEGTQEVIFDDDVLGEVNFVLTAALNDPPSCPDGPATTFPAAGQFFEHGFMIWRGDVAEITVFQDNLTYAVYPDAWTTGMPESDPDIEPPEGFYQPIRGFGLVWREKPSTLGGLVRDHLGWALARYEVEYTGAYQCEVESSAGDSVDCFVRGPDGSIIRMSNSTWDNRQANS
jgi:hypothetical protein